MTEVHHYRVHTLFPAICTGLLTLSFILAKTGRDALFFQGEGLFKLPMAYMLIGVAAIPVAFLFVKVMKICGARPARVGVLIFAAAAMAVFVPFLKPQNYPVLLALFIFVPTIFGILYASVWLLASDIFEKTPKTVASRSFGKIGASSIAGGILGGFLAKGLAPYVDPRWLVMLGSAVILIVACVVIKTHQKFPTNIVPKKDQKKAEKMTLSSVFHRKYARTLLLVSMTGALTGLFIDFQFYAAASSAGMGSKGNANFFANFYIMLSFASLILQIFAAPKIQDWVGLRGGLMILPLALIGGATFVTAAATALSRSVLKVTEGGLKASIHRSIWEQAFIPVDPEIRSFVKIMVDGMGARVAEAIGASALFLWLLQMQVPGKGMPPVSSLDTRWMAWMVLLSVFVWLALTRNLRATVTQEPSVTEPGVATIETSETECTRFPDQCPCTTELGKGVH